MGRTYRTHPVRLRQTPQGSAQAHGVGAVRAALLRCMVALAVAIAAALVPVSVDSVSLDGFDVNRSEAAAAGPAVVAGLEFLEVMASQAGITASEFVATGVGMIASGTGVLIGAGSGVSLSNSFDANLSSLIDTADYPDYDTLDNSEKESWGSRENYESAKFNSFANAFGLGGARDRYYSSGGSGFEFDDSEKGLLEHIGSIAETWKRRVSNAYESIKEGLPSAESVVSVAGVRTFSGDGEGLEDWPSSVPKKMNLGFGSLCYTVKGGSYYVVGTNQNVSWCVYTWLRNGVYRTYGVISMDVENVFLGGYQTKSEPVMPTNVTSSAVYKTLGENDYYVFEIAQGGEWPGIVSQTNMPVNVYDFNTGPSGADIQKAMALLLLNDAGSFNYNLVGEYPEDEIPGETAVWFPEDGIGQETTWPEFTDEQVPEPEPVPRPENPYNPDDETGKPEWRDETEQNVIPLTRIEFDKLFPFSMVANIPKLTSKMNVLQPDEGVYSSIVLLVPDGNGESAELRLEMKPVRDLLLMVRPLLRVFLVFGLVFALVMFWKSILTGD